MRLSLWCSQYEEHKNRYFYYCKKEQSTREWKEVVEKFFKKIKKEIEEYNNDPLDNKREYSEYYSKILLLIIYWKTWDSKR